MMRLVVPFGRFDALALAAFNAAMAERTSRAVLELIQRLNASAELGRRLDHRGLPGGWRDDTHGAVTLGMGTGALDEAVQPESPLPLGGPEGGDLA
jgi:hypothetical protein